MNKHWVSDKPFNPYATDELTAAQQKYFLASQWTLIWWKLKSTVRRENTQSGDVLRLFADSHLFNCRFR